VKTILLADDSITIQKVVELTFSEADYRVICVSSGGQALKKVAEVRPDVILLDVIMPEKNGYEVCEQLKRSPATAGIPILLLTGTFEPFDKKRAETAGANGHLTKPFESQVLVAKVEELIAATPSVAADEEGGRMDIISGGEVYRVDPGRAAEGMRPAPPAGTGLQAAAQAAGAADFVERIASAAAMAPPVPSTEDEDPDRETRPHPALVPPDPGAGGSFVGFGDVGMEAGMEGAIVPDRFDDPSGRPSPSTIRLKRDDVTSRREAGGPGTGPGVATPGSSPDESFAGSFEAEFDLVDEAPAEAVAAVGGSSEDEGTGGWAPPPEAPPAETWQGLDEPEETAPREEVLPPVPDVPAPSLRPAPAAARPEPGGDGRNVPLTPEMIDLIAEKVVERLADRVVREVAWEVVPGVAEALVRKRIKELEDSGS
jgi:CheY-like chemotaxis protein